MARGLRRRDVKKIEKAFHKATERITEEVSKGQDNLFEEVVFPSPQSMNSLVKLLTLTNEAVAGAISDHISEPQNEGTLKILGMIDAACVEMASVVEAEKTSICLSTPLWAHVILSLESFSDGLKNKLADPECGKEARITFTLMKEMSSIIRGQALNAAKEADKLSNTYNNHVASMKPMGSA